MRFLILCTCTGIARPLWALGQGTVRGPQNNGCFRVHIGWGLQWVQTIGAPGHCPPCPPVCYAPVHMFLLNHLTFLVTSTRTQCIRMLGKNKEFICKCIYAIKPFKMYLLHFPIELFIVPASVPQLVLQRLWYVLSCLWDDAYKRTLAANRKE